MKRLRTVWVKSWLTRRNRLGVEKTLLQEFQLKDEDENKRFLTLLSPGEDEGGGGGGSFLLAANLNLNYF